MNFVEPIRNRKKIAQIKNVLRGQKRYRNLLLFVVGINTALRISDLLQLQISHFLDEQRRTKRRFWIKERKRSVWVEPLFGEAKEFHRLRRFRLRRLLKVNIEGVMTAAGQNLKRLIKHNLNMLFSFLKTAFSRSNFHPSPTFQRAGCF